VEQLEAENVWLKKVVTERDLEISVMKEVAQKIASAPARRASVAYAVFYR
jgi:hypothetical protein